MNVQAVHELDRGFNEQGEEIQGEKVYEYTADLTHFIEFGASLADVLAGKASIPAGGLRVDIGFEGPVSGRLGGYIKGVDYLNVRADGRMELDIKAVITTPDGKTIAVSAGGVGLPQEGTMASLLRENVKLTTAHKDYAWVNGLEIWGIGLGDVETGKVTVRGYLAR